MSGGHKTTGGGTDPAPTARLVKRTGWHGPRYLPMPPLSAARRRETCVHEAAHALVYALGGAYVYRVAVAPAGSTDWIVEARKGGTVQGLLGVCRASGPGLAALFLRWSPASEFEGAEWGADRRGFLTLLRSNFPARARAETMRIVRAHVAACLAGPLAAKLHNGEEPGWVEPDPFAKCPDDACMAEMLASLLPRRCADELDNIEAQTLTMLRRPELWSGVQRLAEALDRHGELQGDALEALLPASLTGWPRPIQRGPVRTWRDARRATAGKTEGVTR